MLRITLKIILICILSLKISSTLDLKKTIINTENFFNNIIKKYEMTELSKTQALINQEINQYLKIATQQLQDPRHKKDLKKSNIQLTDAGVFNGLEEVFGLNISDIRDINVFKSHNVGYNQWFIVALTSSNVIVYKIFQGNLQPLTLFPIRDASSLHTVKFHENTLLFVQKPQSIIVLYFFSYDQKFYINEIYQLAVQDLKDLSVWRKKEELFLAASTLTHIFIYTWQSDHLFLVQPLPLPFNPKFSKALQPDNDYELLVASSSDVIRKVTEIFSYDPRTRQYIEVQTIRRSFDDAVLLHLRSSKAEESFLVLSSGGESTIVYKSSDDGFLPFQQIGPADRVFAIGKNNTLLLILLKDDVVNIYQYDGWRFIRLDSQIFGVESAKLVDFDGEKMIFIKRVDGRWNLNRINWMKVNQPVNFNDEIHKWCLTAKHSASQIPKFPEVNAPIHMSKGELKRAKVKRINNVSVEQLQNLTERYNQLYSRVSAVNESLKMLPTNHRFKTLRARTIRAECTNGCTASNLVADLGCDIFSNLPRVNDKGQHFVFEHVKVDTLDGFPCPVAGVELKEVNVKGLLNGADFDEIHKNALRTSGDQVVSAEHIFANLRVDSIVAPNLEPASTHTRQKLRTTAIHAKEFNLTEGSLLLPLDGEPVTMTGSLTASKVKFNGLVDQRGSLKGFKRYAPMINFPEYHELNGDYHLRNVKVSGLLSASDVARSKGGVGKTLGEIAKRVVRLDEDVPVRLALRSNATLLKNVTLGSLPNWLTRKNQDMVRVTGEKVALKKVTLSDELYQKLPVPKIETPVCSIGAVTSDIKTSTISVGQATAKIVESQNVIGARDLDSAISEAVISLSQVDLSRKNFNGTVTIKNLNLLDLENSPFYSFQKSEFKWYRPDVMEGPVRATNLKVGSLTTNNGIKIPSPTEIRNMVVEGNLQVETINGIELDTFLSKIIKLTDKAFLKNVIFEGALEAGEIQTRNVNFDLQNFENGVFLGSKVISGDLEIEGDLWIPNLLSYPPIDEIESYVVEGSVNFKKEPDVFNFNGKNLHQLASEIWLLNRPTALTGSFKFEKITLLQSSPSYKSLQTPYFGSWESLESRLLSKTKLQEITIPVYLKTATIPNIIISGNSTLRSSDQYLNDLLYMSLKKNGNQTIRDSWHFDKLIVEGKFSLLGKINNLNLSSDVARYDIERNYVTGEKIIDELTVRNLKGLNFNEWTKDAFLPSNSKNITVIKGKKTFKNLNARLVQVNGTVMGKKLEECLLKTGDQVITAPKVIDGSLHTPSLKVDGLVNDIDFKKFANNLLRKDKPVQRIASKVVFKGNLEVMGDVYAKNIFKGVGSSKINLLNETLVSAMKKLEYLKPFAIGIEQTMKKQAKYWDKFEFVKDTILPTASTSSSAANATTRFHILGDCVLTSLSKVVCDGQNIYPLKLLSNSTGVLINQLLSVDNVPLVIQVSSGPRSRITIYVYDYVKNSFDVAKNMRAPGITRASVSTLDGIVWIATRLKSQMMIVRFEIWNDLLQYHLPDSRIFALDVVPATNELVLVREDGMWKLEGLTGPRHAFKVHLSADGFETFANGNDFFIRLMCKNAASKLLKARYVGV